ncbi:MAG: CPBP family intramembrane metalloprotease [Defluviitaleaceae bacterium]|nr:CPBP family intramembrane metalloprotease [Defluviitaleaceae bacterium]
MLHIILLVSLVLFFTIGSVAGVKQTKHQLETDIDEKARTRHYAAITFSMWIPVIILFIVAAFSDITFADIGFTLPSFALHPAVTAIVFAAVFIWTAYFVYMIVAFLTSAKHRRRRNEILIKKENGNDYYDLVVSKLMTPMTKAEKRWWFGVSFTAGMCEEIIFRGAFIFLLVSIFPDISIYWVAAGAVVLFGLGHLYQGMKGLVLTTLVGAFFTLIYIASGSLLFVIVIHFIQNFANAFEYSDEMN